MKTKKEDRRVVLQQKHWIFKCPRWLQRMFTKTYYTQGIVQFDNGELTICGDSIKWLDEFQIKATSYKKADKVAFEYLKNKYPEYGDYVQLF